MAKLEKLHQKIQDNPNHVSPNDLHNLLEGYGFSWRTGSKHWRVYWHPELGAEGRLTVPFRRPLKAYIVRQALKKIDLLGRIG